MNIAWKSMVFGVNISESSGLKLESSVELQMQEGERRGSPFSRPCWLGANL